jgi:exodeoxyribonuclease V alpha subunit
VGDPFQLASVEAGTVLGDMVGPGGASDGAAGSPLAGRVTELRRGHRFDAGSEIAELALAIRDGDADTVLDRLSDGTAVHWIRPDDPVALATLRDRVVAAATEVVAAAVSGDGAAALGAATRLKVLAAVRRGPCGLFDWSDRIDAAALEAVPTVLRGGSPRVGTPVMVTHNDPVNRLANGDVGVVVLAPDGRWVVMAGAPDLRRLAPARLGRWESWWAMTIHKSQGSEFPHAVVSLPTVDSPILTRELLYTAVTRAKHEVTVVGSDETIRRAVERPVARASGLGERLWPAT